MLTAWRASVELQERELACALAYLVAEIRFGQVAHVHILPDLEQSLALPGPIGPSSARARYILGRSAATVGDYTLASACFQAAVEYCEQNSDPNLEALLWCGIAIHHQPGRDRLADALRAVAVAEAGGRLAAARTIEGFVRSALGSREDALPCFDEALRLFSFDNDDAGVAWVLAGMSRDTQHRATIVPLLERLLALEREGIPKKEALWIQIGVLLLRLGETEDACLLYTSPSPRD